MARAPQGLSGAPAAEGRRPNAKTLHCDAVGRPKEAIDDG